LYILIGLVILILATFVIAYFASRTWHWAYVLVVVGIVLSTAGSFILAAEVLRINSVLRTNYIRHEQQLADQNERIAALQEGTDDPALINKLRGEELRIAEDAASVPSLGELEHQIRLKTHVRGRIWRTPAPGAFDPQTGAVVVGLEAPVPAGLAPDSVVYLFEQGDLAAADPLRGAQYLGEFRVSQTAAQQATLLPTMALADYERQRLGGSRRPWVIYETMPADQHTIFAGMSEEELRQRLPASVVEEYLRHGQPPSTDDDEYHRAWYDEEGKRVGVEDVAKLSAEERSRLREVYHRPARDFAFEFGELAKRIGLLLTTKAALEQDNQRLELALAAARALGTFREEEIQKYTADLNGLAGDIRAVQQHLTIVQQQVDRLRVLIEQTLRQSSQLVRDLAARQAAVAAAVDRTTSLGSPPAGPAIGRAN
jgi:hypothetical protein